MRTPLTILLMVAALALGMLAPAAANSLQSDSTPATVHSVTRSGDWYVIRHDLNVKAEDTYWSEAVKFANQERQSTGDGRFNHLYLYAPSHARGHKGKVTVYYDLSGGDRNDWVHITAQFNGKGELLHANHVSP